MMPVELLSHSFNEHTLAWLLASTVLGGVIGAAITFFFEDTLRHAMADRREKRKLYQRFRNPLLQAAISLERQINTTLRNTGKAWLVDEYFKLSVLFKFGTFLFWVHRIEQETGFLDMQSTEEARQFTQRLYGPFSGLSSIRSYCFSPNSALPRDILRAIGEEMQKDGAQESNPKPMGFGAFTRRYGSDPQFRRWFASINAALAALASSPAPSDYVDRLVVTGAHLRLLARWLDPKRTYSEGNIDNLDLLHCPERLQKLTEDVQRTENERSAKLKLLTRR